MSLCHEVMEMRSEFGRKASQPVQRSWGSNELSVDFCKSAEVGLAEAEGDVREGRARLQEPCPLQWEFES